MSLDWFSKLGLESGDMTVEMAFLPERRACRGQTLDLYSKLVHAAAMTILGLPSR